MALEFIQRQSLHNVNRRYVGILSNAPRIIRVIQIFFGRFSALSNA
jgi:hypothetical protein